MNWRGFLINLMVGAALVVLLVASIRIIDHPEREPLLIDAAVRCASPHNLPAPKWGAPPRRALADPSRIA